jgi:Trp operon repressor
MVNLSKIPVDQKKLSKLFHLLYEIVNKVEDKDDFLGLIKDILSPSEQLMVAKRIAIIYLLMKGVDQSTIAEYLKTSRATVAKFSLLFYDKETQLIAIISELLSKAKISHFLEDLFADLFIQPGIKIGHWQMYWDHKRKQSERKMIEA